MTNADGYKSRWSPDSVSAGATEEIARNKILQLIKPTSAGPIDDRPDTDAEFQKLKTSISLGAAKLRELTNRNRSESVATEQTMGALRREVGEEKARYERLKKDFEAHDEEHRHRLAAAERRIVELEASNKSLVTNLEVANRELARLRQWFFNLSADAEAIHNAIDDANHLISRKKQV